VIRRRPLLSLHYNPTHSLIMNIKHVSTVAILSATITLSTSCMIKNSYKYAKPITSTQSNTQPPSFEHSGDSCVAQDTVQGLESQKHSYIEEEAAKMMRAKGWRELTTTASIYRQRDRVGGFEPEEIAGFKIKRHRKGRLVDELGRHWLLVDRTDECSNSQHTYYINEKKEVFIVHKVEQCKDTHQYTSCGSIDVPGCGTPPIHTIDLYKLVPKGAKLIERKYIYVPLDNCYAFTPENGYHYPH